MRGEVDGARDEIKGSKEDNERLRTEDELNYETVKLRNQIKREACY